MLTCKRAKFSLPNQPIYLNGAYMSPLLKKVEKAGLKGLLQKRTPYKVVPDDFFHTTQVLRSAFASLVDTPETERIVIIPSVSYGMATVVKNLPLDRRQNIVVAGEQFPSNVYPWMRLCEKTGATLKIIQAPEVQENRGKLWNEKIIQAIDQNTAAVALAPIHWADGTRFLLQEVSEKVKGVGGKLIVDGTQSVGVVPFSIREIKPDALVCAGYKWLLGPYGIGLAYFNESFDHGEPLEENWINRKGSEDFSNLINYQNQYQPGALRYEVGEHSNFILTPMILAAVQQINRWKPENMLAYIHSITTDGLSSLKEMGLWVEDDTFRSPHLFGIRLPEKLNMNTVKEKLQAEKISVSYRGNTIRVSPNVYNKQEEINKLVKTFKHLLH